MKMENSIFFVLGSMIIWKGSRLLLTKKNKLKRPSIGEYDILSEPRVSAKKTVGLCAYARIEKMLIFFWFWKSFASVMDDLMVEC